jgi:putative nucleotidyltransferase with HDIG domain
LAFAGPFTAEYGFVPPTSLHFKTQLDRALEAATSAEREDEVYVLARIREIAEAADPAPNTLSGHSCRVSRLARRIAEQMDLESLVIERISAAALFHDIGKSRIDSRIWSKPSVLDAEEFELVKMHPVLGAEMMRVWAPLDEIIPGIELHHEALDGSGYPYGLHGSEIPLTARVTTIADAFDAMTSMRIYQAPLAAEAALNTLRHLAGVKFDACAVVALCDVMGGCVDQGTSGPEGLFDDLIVRTA